MDKLKIALASYLTDNKYVYWKVVNCIVVLEKLKNTITNESRSDVMCKEYALFRANQLSVVKIIDIMTQESFNGIKKRRYYEVGEIVEDYDYDENVNDVHSNGIFYFLRLEPAFYYNKKVDDNETYVQWYDNGQKKLECTLCDGMVQGKSFIWHRNGVKYAEYNNIDGKLEGKCLEWFDDGTLSIEWNFKNGLKNGIECHMYENGKKKFECTYADDKKNGKYEEWYDDGKMRTVTEYKNNMRHGKHIHWLPNGDIKIECHYENGKMIKN